MALFALMPTAPVDAQEIVLGSGTQFGTGGGQTVTISMQEFELYQRVENVQIELRAFGNTFNADGTKFWLLDDWGPGTTDANLLTTNTFPVAAMSVQWIPVLAIDALNPGSYGIGISPLSPGNYMSLVPTVTTGGTANEVGKFGTYWNITIGGSYNAAFPPGSNFNTSGAGFAHQYRIRGDLTTQLPGGADTKFNIDAVDILGHEGAVSDGLKSIHKLIAESVAGSQQVNRSNTIAKQFTFEREDGQSTPTLTSVSALLDGLLLADNGGIAEVQAFIWLTDQFGQTVGSDSVNLDISPGVGQVSDAIVNELLSIQALLVPGEDYTLHSTLSVGAFSPLNGGARALFSNTFTVELGAIPEPASLALLAVGGVMLLTRRKSDTRDVQ